MNLCYPEVADRANHRCEYCHAPEIAFSHPFEVEHVIPQSRGGSNDLMNLALACRSCNLFKSAHVSVVDADGVTIPLFNPRVQRWDDHFAVDAETLSIVALTGVGRITTDLLRLNIAYQLTARRLWLQMLLFP